LNDLCDERIPGDPHLDLFFYVLLIECTFASLCSAIDKFEGLALVKLDILGDV
jgi:hypothetical protein